MMLTKYLLRQDNKIVMLYIFLHLIISYIFFWLTGFAVFAFLSKIKPPQPTYVILPLAGFILQVPVLSYLSLLFPLNTNIFLAISIVLLTIFILKSTYFTQFTIHHSPFTIHKAQLSVFLILLLLAASQTPTLPDMWGYHAQSIQWIEKYHVVTGLGNLCSKFAFNFGTFLPLAILSFRPLTGQPLFTINAFLSVLVLLYVFYIIKKIDQFPISIILLLGVFAVFHYFKSDISSTSVECSSSLLILLLFFLYLSKNYQTEDNNEISSKWIIIGLILILPVIKLTNSVFILLLLPFLWKTKIKAWFSIILIFIFFPWIYRNVTMSGYPWYPIPQFDPFHYNWAIPKDFAWNDFYWIKSWARIPYLPAEQVLNIPFFDWVKIWAGKTGFFTWFFLLSGSIFSITALTDKKVIKSIPQDIKILWFILWLSIIAWFFTAPDPRFIIGSLIILTLIPLLYLSARSPFTFLVRYYKTTVFSSKNVLLIAILFFFISESFIYNPLSFNNLIKPAPFPSQKMKPWYLDNIAFHSPEKGVNCYDYPLPCAPEMKKGLTLKGKNIQDGFIILNQDIDSLLPKTLK